MQPILKSWDFREVNELPWKMQSFLSFHKEGTFYDVLSYLEIRSIYACQNGLTSMSQFVPREKGNTHIEASWKNL